MTARAPETLARLRRLVAGLAVLGLLGIAVELWLIEHVEGLGQAIPLVVLPLAAVCLAVVGVSGASRGVTMCRVVLGLVVATGAAGVGLHIQESWEFQRELDPAASFTVRVAATMRAQSPPSLAPGQIALLGLLGLAATSGLTPAGPSSVSNKEHTS